MLLQKVTFWVLDFERLQNKNANVFVVQ